ncbi:glycoside hydrolase family 15 protein [Serpula lacrymans var. lacrymans S7.3]|uniref:Glucoamylase n=2 Tax=Serpula lacrymans var. lacrymans TaxID=341189 RepID=F8Q033_SERL3|nr:glycoside hydrolase family 15 protein [Serpula lacrymans var. lacrymans S7.9]EGN98505.1 glycoside hydrolase family 15 protein [Serpula lacrymans var. lacrymans S7.3]EGO24079.1 glycoside hydrolase family 15 protein [Serpula lacrymans var. lacrymans S7.9]
MRRFVLSALALCVSVVAQSSTVDSYISTESPIAQAGLLANIGPDGSKSSGAYPGVVIASPSTTNPDYLYTWVRDSSLVFKTLIDQFTAGNDASLRTLIDDFTTAEAAIQQITNPSGSVSTGGLGEPKFNINETAFTGAWGRPQRDGPALRSTALITYANWLLANNNASYVSNTLWPIIKLDLDYVSNNWNQSTFDLWEEIDSSSFFTTAVQHMSLRQGSTLATAIGQTSVVSGYNTQADNLLCFLQSYWNPTGGYITANTGGGRSGIDANTVLASIHTFDVDAGCDAATFQPCSDVALSNLKVYVDSFRSIYSINSGIASDAAVATGRYPEDVYQGGNPWYLTTFAVAEQLYDSLTAWSKAGSLNVTSTSLAFFQQFSSGVTAGSYASSTSTYSTLTTAIKNFADGFIAVDATYTPSGGALAEQYGRSNGTPVSAVDLTWSYASALTVFAARAGNVSASWGAAGLAVPATCSGNSGPTVAVTFNVDATTVEGENIYVSGSVGALGNWDTSSAIAMSAANYPTWSVTVNVTASSNIQYKYIRIQNGAVTWESDPNNSITTPASGTYTTNDTWR